MKRCMNIPLNAFVKRHNFLQEVLLPTRHLFFVHSCSTERNYTFWKRWKGFKFLHSLLNRRRPSLLSSLSSSFFFCLDRASWISLCLCLSRVLKLKAHVADSREPCTILSKSDQHQRQYEWTLRGKV